MSFKYLSKEIISGFDNYKYSSLDTSPISKYVMHPFWNWLVQFYPIWLAPNLITQAGFGLLALCALLLSIYDPSYHASNNLPDHPPIPSFIFFISGFCFFWAHQLDGTDGKQARRIGSSTPLGEMMDHGLDSWASVLMPYCLYSIFGRGDGHEPYRIWFVVLSVTFMFYLTHWEKYNTGVLYLPWGYDLSQLGMTLLFLLASMLGTDIWKVYWPYLPINSIHVFEFLVHGSVWLLGVPMCLHNLYISYRNKTGNMLSLKESLLPLYPILLLFSLISFWIYISPYDILNQHPRILFLMFGSVYSNITCRCIVNCMSRTRCDAYNHLLTPIIVFVITIITIPSGYHGNFEYYFLIGYLVIASLIHFRYVYHVVTELADHFGIFVFTVKPQVKNKY